LPAGLAGDRPGLDSALGPTRQGLQFRPGNPVPFASRLARPGDLRQGAKPAPKGHNGPPMGLACRSGPAGAPPKPPL